MALEPTNLAGHEQETPVVESTPSFGMIQPAPAAAIPFVELAAICHVLEVKLDHSSSVGAWKF